MCLFYASADNANGKVVGGHAGGVGGADRRRCRRDGRGAATAETAVEPVQPGSPGLRDRLRLRRCPGAGGRAGGQDGAVRGRAATGRGRLRAVLRVQAGPVGVRGRVFPAGGTVAPVQPRGAAGAHGRAESDGRRAVRHRAKDVRGRARARVQAAVRGAGRVTIQLLQLPVDRPQMSSSRMFARKEKQILLILY